MKDTPAIIQEAGPSVGFFVELEHRIDGAESDGIEARWEFGRALLAERIANGGKQLPHGRLAEIVAATGKSEAEIRNRIQFAEEYKSPSEVATAVATFRSWTELRESLGERTGKAHVAYNSGENEWYTPAPIIEAARAVMGAIDLDPASHPAANRVVGATRFYTREDDGLVQKWEGRVWLNPPYASDLVERFTAKLVDEYLQDTVTEACLLSNNATETKWFQKSARVAGAVCFPAGRISYWQPGTNSKTPLQGQTILYFGAGAGRFSEVFADFGVVFTA